jgi:hypothetical protein
VPGVGGQVVRHEPRRDRRAHRLAAGERLFAAGVGGALERGLPGHERLCRPLGHLAAMSVLGGSLYRLMRRVDHRIERGAEQVEEAYDQAPASQLVSGGRESGVAWETLSRQGRPNVASVLTPAAIEAVMGEPAAAEPIRVFIGLESALTEAERVALAVEELRRTGAFDRELLLMISPTGTGAEADQAGPRPRAPLATGRSG